MARGVMTLKAVVTTITVMVVITMIVSMFLVPFYCIPIEFHSVSKGSMVITASNTKARPVIAATVRVA